MKKFLQISIAAIVAITMAQNLGAQTQTTIYETTFPNANSVNAASGWVLINGTAWVSTNGGVSGGGSLRLGASTSATATMPVFSEDLTNVSIEITAIWGSYIYYQTSPNGTTWTPASNYNNVFEGSSGSTTIKSLPDGTRYIRFTARDASGDMYIQSIKITGTPLCAEIVPPTNITLNQTSASVGAGSRAQLRANLTPSSCVDKTVTWSSSDPSVATVNATGLVAGKKAGVATITATTVNGLTASCEVTVTPWTGTIATAFGGGTGTKDDPYLISSESELSYFCNYVRNGNATAGKYFLQTRDLDLNYESVFTYSYPFKGHFNGNGFKISNVGTYALFRGGVSGATIHNVHIASGTITYGVSALADTAINSTFSYCSNAANVTRNAQYVGGLVGASGGNNKF